MSRMRNPMPGCDHMTNRRHRLRRVTKWTSTFLSALILLVWILSVPLITRSPLALIYDRPPVWAVLQYGNIMSFIKQHDTGVYHQGLVLTHQNPASNWHGRLRYGLLLPSLEHDESKNYWEGYLPLWLPFLMFAAPTAFLWYRDRRIPAGHCQACGYDLRGNVSGICPECGKQIPVPVNTP